MVAHNADEVRPEWLTERAALAEERLRQMDPQDLGPAGRLLMEYGNFGNCDVTDCVEEAIHVVVGEAGDLYLCAAHHDGGGDPS